MHQSWTKINNIKQSYIKHPRSLLQTFIYGYTFIFSNLHTNLQIPVCISTFEYAFIKFSAAQKKCRFTDMNKFIFQASAASVLNKSKEIFQYICFMRLDIADWVNNGHATEYIYECSIAFISHNYCMSH